MSLLQWFNLWRPPVMNFAGGYPGCCKLGGSRVDSTSRATVSGCTKCIDDIGPLALKLTVSGIANNLPPGGGCDDCSPFNGDFIVVYSGNQFGQCLYTSSDNICGNGAPFVQIGGTPTAISVIWPSPFANFHWLKLYGAGVDLDCLNLVNEELPIFGGSWSDNGASDKCWGAGSTCKVTAL